jgi:hypothetical protein
VAFGLLNAFVALTKMVVTCSKPKTDTPLVLVAVLLYGGMIAGGFGASSFFGGDGAGVIEITQSEYDRERNQEAHLFFGIALAGWSSLTLFAFMARTRYPG